MADSFFFNDRRAGQLVDLTLSDGNTVQAYVQTTIAVDATGVPTGSAANPTQTISATLGTTDLTPVVVAITTATTTEIVAASAGETTRVYRMTLNVAGANVLTFKSGATQLREPLSFTAAGFLVYDFSERAWMTTAVNEALNVTTTTTAAVNITVEVITGP